MQHDARKAGSVLRDDTTFSCCLRPSFNISLRGGEERVDNACPERGVGQGEPTEEQWHELKNVGR